MRQCRWSRRGWTLLLMAVTLSSFASRQAACLDLAEITTVFNPNCVTFTVLGPCLCGYPPTPSCLQVGYWEPAYLVETVKKPGDTTLVPIANAFSVLSPTALFGGGGAGNTGGSGRTNLHFNEGHVMAFPQLRTGPCSGCSSQLSTTVHYLSELDAPWRVATGLPDLGGLLGLGALGTWGLLYPRSGWAIHGSPSVASGIAAARAMDIAAFPWGSPTHPETRVVLQQAHDAPLCMQLATPRVTDCFLRGKLPATWEQRTGSRDGKYLWVVWRYSTCCVYPNQVACGFTLGGAGANRCGEP